MTPQQLNDIREYQRIFDTSNGIEGVNTGMPYTCMCMAGELGEFVEAYYEERDLAKARIELTDVFIYAVILANQLDYTPVIEYPPHGVEETDYLIEMALGLRIAKRIGRVSEAVKKHARAVASNNGNAQSRLVGLHRRVDDLFYDLVWAAQTLQFDLSDSYFTKMAHNQLTVSKYKG